MLEIQVLPLSSHVRGEDLERLSDGDICACDFYVDGIETATAVPGGYQRGRILNIDHHAPTTAMASRISSANLAIERVVQVGRPRGIVAINHTDCDSVLSAGIVSGDLEPLPEFGRAAIAADHTGEENAIADLLQGLASLREYDTSLMNLQRLLGHRPLTPLGQRAVDARARRRALACDAVATGRVVRDGPLAVGVLDQPMDSVFFPALLPEAAVILLMSPLAGEQDRWHARLRLGAAAPQDFTLHHLSWDVTDAGYAGRWNAGSNSRAGGTALPPPAYADLLRCAVATHLCPS